MSALEMFAKEAMKTKGIFHMNAIRTLRLYINETRDHDLLEAVEHINDTDLLRTLIEAGLHEPILTAVTKRAEEIPKRMRGEVT